MDVLWRILVISFFFALGSFEETEEKTKNGEQCKIEDLTAVCGDNFRWPENKRITKLVIRSLKFKEISKNDLAPYEDLKSLDFSNSGLHHIDPDSFKNNENLTDLDLSGIKDLHITKEEPFISSKSLRFLNFSRTNIKELPGNIFTELPNLEEIDLSNTSVKNFSSLYRLEHLQTIIISESSSRNKLSICKKSHLKQIIEIGNEKQLIFDCSLRRKTDEDTTKANEDDTTWVAFSGSSENLNEDPENLNNTNLEYKEILENSTIDANMTENSTKIAETTTESENITSTTKLPEVTSPQGRGLPPPPPPPMGGHPPPPPPIGGHPPPPPPPIGGMPPPPPPIGDAEVKAVGPPPPPPTESSGTKIVLGIILVVIVVGALGFGYKFWKNRRQGYRNANTEDIEEGKELQTIVGGETRREEGEN